MYKVYLAGPITAVDLTEAVGWRKDARLWLGDYGLKGYSPLRGKEPLLPQDGLIGFDPANYEVNPLTSAKGITTRDRYDVSSCDLMIANLLDSQDQPSIGTAIEFGWADAWKIPVIVVIERDVIMHPMLETIAGFRVESVVEACDWAARILTN